MVEVDGVVGVYGSMRDAEEAVRILLEQGVPAQRVSVIGQELRSQTEVHGFVTAEDGTGGWSGGLFGVLSGAALLLVPGVGPLLVLGPLAAGAVAAAQDAAAEGGGLDALLAHFLAERHVPAYAQHVQAGSYLVVSHGPGEPDGAAVMQCSTTPVAEVEHIDDLVPAQLAGPPRTLTDAAAALE
ncbi:general stress protein [Kitasatospora sp. NPDC094015]|uniref:general stress protein n=1 Tax=Kitasatospora sp. NPDC094015 TaxID=3155205 RepID=UPI00332F358F